MRESDAGGGVLCELTAAAGVPLADGGGHQEARPDVLQHYRLHILHRCPQLPLHGSP